MGVRGVADTLAVLHGCRGAGSPSPGTAMPSLMPRLVASDGASQSDVSVRDFMADALSPSVLCLVTHATACTSPSLSASLMAEG